MIKEKNISNSEKNKQKKSSAHTTHSQLSSGGELHQIAGGKHSTLTTNQGIAISDNQNSLRANHRGPTLALNKMPDKPATAVPVQQMDLSPALQVIGKMKNTLMGRAVGVLISDGSDGIVINKIKKAVTDVGATVKIIAPKVGGAKLADGSMLAVDGQLAGTPSVLFDAVAVILSGEGVKAMSAESAAVDFVRDAFGHLKAIAVDKRGQAFLKLANVGQDAGIVNAHDKDAFISQAKTRQWAREKSVRTLA